MKYKKLSILLLAVLSIILVSCKKDDDTGKINVNITGLPNLGPDYVYEGWMVGGQAITAGIFRVNDQGVMSATTFEVDKEGIDDAVAYVLTIEPYPDPDPKPSAVHILAGNFSGNSATIGIANPRALVHDYSSAAGSYILATPTDGNSDTDELSGVWWMNPAAGPGPGLTMPTLPTGWNYEGWVVINGIPVSTGKFRDANGADGSSVFSGTVTGPAFPGEDLLQNAPTGLNFPTDLSGATLVISIEPDPDNGPEPFSIKPLKATIPMPAANGVSYNMTNDASSINITGTVSR